MTRMSLEELVQTVEPACECVFGLRYLSDRLGGIGRARGTERCRGVRVGPFRRGSGSCVDLVKKRPV
jgi:hypothetical protein